MTTDTTITIENNVLAFKYFDEQPENSSWKAFDENIKGIYYKAEYTRYPYLSTKNKLIKLDDKRIETKIRPFEFLIQEVKTEPARFDYMPHNFIFSQSLEEASTGENVFEIRTKNQHGVWQDWQAIVGEFSIYKVVKQGNKIFLVFPIEETVEELKNLFEIRYSGFLNISNFGDAQIISEEDIKLINLNTHQIEFFADSGNLCWLFEDRVFAWKNFEDKYFKY